jgi:hypothetical protein
VVAGGLAVVPAGAFAQEPVPTAAAPPPPEAASTAAPSTPAADPAATTDSQTDAQRAEASGCPPPDPRDPEETLTPVEPDPAVTASREKPDDGPTAHCSQNAGDNQYRDPFANSPPPKNQNAADGAQAPQSDTSDQSTAGSATLLQDDGSAVLASDAETGSGPRLPNTGLGLGGLVGLGAPLIAGGVALRRRLA